MYQWVVVVAVVVAGESFCERESEATKIRMPIPQLTLFLSCLFLPLSGGGAGAAAVEEKEEEKEEEEEAEVGGGIDMFGGGDAGGGGDY